MSINCRSCHGHIECLQASSTKSYMDAVLRKPQRIWIYAKWYIENRGFSGTLKYTLSTIVKPFALLKRKDQISAENERVSLDAEVLNLAPGELVEVKSQQEILSTLRDTPDKPRAHKGLVWMMGQAKYCGKRYRVFKRVETIRIEVIGELRKMKNTVLLEGVMCDGFEFYGCDRSCFYFWHEAWLRRVND